MLNGLDLFSGIGGLSVALSGVVRPLAYCENERYCQGVLLSRMRTGDLRTAPIWDDVRTLKGQLLPAVDIIYGGFPCQDISVAGNGAGLEGSRSGLFFEVVRLVREIAPTFVFLENVPAIRTRGAERVVKELASLGYDCRWTVVSAADVGAPHRRDRWFLLAAHTERIKLWDEQGRLGGASGEGSAQPRHNGSAQYMADPDCAPGGRSRAAFAGASVEAVCGGAEESGRCSSDVADPDGPRLEIGKEQPSGHELAPAERSCSLGHADGEGQLQQEGSFGTERGWSADASWWATEPDVGRVAHGVPARVDRLRGLGNAVVPLQARTAFETLMGLTNGEMDV